MSGIQERQKEPIRVLAVDSLRAPLTGKTDIKVRIQRNSDGLYFDWFDFTFKAGASVTRLLQVMAEVSATYAPGVYYLTVGSMINGFDTNLITNYTTNEIYFVTILQDGGSDAVNLPQTSEIRVGVDVLKDKSPVIF